MAEATVCVNEETRITLCSIRATKGNPPFSCSVGERKIMNHFVVKSSDNHHYAMKPGGAGGRKLGKIFVKSLWPRWRAITSLQTAR